MFVCVCTCGELMVGKEVGFLVHVHVWASEYKMKYISKLLYFSP